MSKKENKRKGFTLVELLAVIVVLAVILLIATPKIQTVIESSRQSSIEATTKVIADNAEMIYANKKLLDKNYNVNEDPILCDEVAKISSDDYGTCKITFNDEGEASVLLRGKGSFEGYSCRGTSKGVNCIKIVANNFKTDSWQTIQAVILAAKESNPNNPELNSELAKYKVGDTKCITLKGFTATNGNVCGAHDSFKVRIANNSNYNCTLESETACGFVVEFVDIITSHNMNNTSTNKGGWLESSMRTYLTSNILPKLEESIGGDIIIDTTVVSGHGSKDTSNFITKDKLYLLSAAEIWKDVKDADNATSSIITRQLDFYSGTWSKELTSIDGENCTISLANSPIKLTYNSGQWFFVAWWLRGASVYSNPVGLFTYVPGSSDCKIVWHYYADDEYGVAPAFRIG